MATDFPMTPVDRLPIFAHEACGAVILVKMVQGGDGMPKVHSLGGSRLGVVEAGVSAGAGFSGTGYGDQISVDGGGGAVSDFNESEGDNADAFEQGGTRVE
ncbi:uncharacterized protein [Triticum aestivum]|uniref:uncharacterized protein n=1 Tax=Triticum aestivum TaxID=4565 RepID=UPI001D01FA5D|nr:uncharacterized protein LOC123153201 [Triticum aestivum]